MAIVASNSLTVSNVSDGTITHTAYSKSMDGMDGFATVYPNLNLLEDGKFAKPISSKWSVDGTTISKDDITGYFKVIFNGTGSYNRAYYTASVSTIPIGQKYSVYIKAYSLEDSLNIKLGTVNTSQAVTVTKNSNTPKTYKVEGLVRGTSNTFGIFGGLTTTIGTLFISEIKAEPGSTATPWMPSSSEVITADWPKYRGEYSDTSSEQSTNPSDYTWGPMRGDDGKPGADGTDGTSGIIVSSVAPTSPKNGQLWQDTSTTPQLVKKWTGASWVIWELYAQNLKADKLSAIISNLGDVTAGTYTSWNFSDTGALNYLNGVYLYDGHLRSISIENSTVTDPDKNLTSKSYLIRGSDMYGGMVTFFNNKITTSAKPNDLLKGSSFFSGSNQAAVLDSSRDSSGVSALDIKSDNVKISGYASQTIPWTKMIDFAYYKVMFGRVNIRVDLTSGSSRDNIYLGAIPDKYKSPNGDQMFPAQAWKTGIDFDRHVQYNADGNLYLINPEPNTAYVFEISYTL